MTVDKTDFLEDALLQHIFNSVALPTIDDPELVLLSDVGTQDQQDAVALPSPSLGYTHKTTAEVNTAMGASSGGTITNSGAIVFGPASGGSWAAVVGVGVRATVSGNYLYVKGITSVTVNEGESLSFDAANFTVIET